MPREYTRLSQPLPAIMSVEQSYSSPATSEKLRDEVMEDRDLPPSSDQVTYGGEDTLPPPPVLTLDEERRLWWKIDSRFMPVVTMLYLVSFLDRSNIGE